MSARTQVESGGWTPPTDEQLANFASVMLAAEARRRGIGFDADFAKRMVLANSTLKEVWLRRHRELQGGER